MLHRPVFLREVLSFLAINPAGTYVDCTVGQGGHSVEIARHLNAKATLILIDQDATSLAFAKQRCAFFLGRLIVIHGNFIALKRHLFKHQIKQVDGFLYDCGFSAPQIYDPTRGFSYQRDGPLDMRMNRHQTLSAATIVNQTNFSQLRTLIRTFGEEPHAAAIAEAICAARQTKAIQTTAELSKIIQTVYARLPGKTLKHPARLTFQALRIAVNNELNALQASIKQTEIFQKNGMRIVIITYHSLEDRIVKNYFSSLVNCRLLTPKPLVASSQAIAANFQARSAKLRAIVYG